MTDDGLSHGWLTSRRSLEAQDYFEGQRQVWVPRPRVVAHPAHTRSYLRARPPRAGCRETRRPIERSVPPPQTACPRDRHTRRHARRAQSDIPTRARALQIWLPKSRPTSLSHVDPSTSLSETFVDHHRDVELHMGVPVIHELQRHTTSDTEADVIPRQDLIDLGASQPLTVSRQRAILLFGKSSLVRFSRTRPLHCID